MMAGARMGQRRAEEQYEQQLQQKDMEVQQAQQQAAQAPPPVDTTAELKKLADLHASGALTDEEFAASKKKLLGL